MTEDLPPDPFPGPKIEFAPCPCGRTHEEHEDHELISTLAAMVQVLLPEVHVAIAFTDDRGGVGVVANAGSDASTINLLGLAIHKIYQASPDKDSIPMSVIPLVDPKEN